MNAEKIKEIVSDGKWFKVKFYKKDGTIRDMTCRTGVSAYVVGGGAPAPAHVVRVWEKAPDKEGKEAYRSFDVNSVIEIHAHGKVFKQEDLK